jgi:hypothetical protein
VFYSCSFIIFVWHPSFNPKRTNKNSQTDAKSGRRRESFLGLNQSSDSKTAGEQMTVRLSSSSSSLPSPDVSRGPFLPLTSTMIDVSRDRSRHTNCVTPARYSRREYVPDINPRSRTLLCTMIWLRHRTSLVGQTNDRRASVVR